MIPAKCEIHVNGKGLVASGECMVPNHYFDIDEFGPIGIPEIGAPGLDFDADPVLLDVMRQKDVEDKPEDITYWWIDPPEGYDEYCDNPNSPTRLLIKKLESKGFQ